MPDALDGKNSKRVLDLDALGGVPPSKGLGDQLDAIQKSLTPAFRSQERVVELMRPYLELGVEISRGISATTAKIGAAVARFNKDFVPVLAAIAVALERYPERLRGNLLVLAQEGWYLDPEWTLPISLQLEEELAGGSKEAFDRWIMASFRSALVKSNKSCVSSTRAAQEL